MLSFHYWFLLLLITFVYSLFLQMFLFHQHSLPWLIFVTSFLCCCTASATNLREHFLLSYAFYLTFLPDIWYNLLYQDFPGSDSSASKVAGPPIEVRDRPIPSLCFNHTVFGNCMIHRELYLDLPKYVDKLLVAKSLISYKHFS